MFFISGLKVTDFIIKPALLYPLILGFIKDIRKAVKKEDRVHNLTFLCIMLVAICIRVFYLFQPLYNDESRVFAMRIYDVAEGVKGVANVLTQYMHVGDHVFHTLLAYLSYKLFGSEQSLWVMRIPVLISGILVVPASYLMARILYNSNVALVTSGIVACSSPLVFYSVNARGHIIITLFFLISLALGTYLIKNNQMAGWHLFSILSAVGFYTVPTMLYPYGVVVTWLLLNGVFKGIDYDRSCFFRRMMVSMALTCFFTALLYSPILFSGDGLTIIKRLRSQHPAGLMEFINYLPVAVEYVWVFWNRSLPYLISLFLVAGFVASLLFHKKISAYKIPVVYAVFIFLVPLVFIQKRIIYPRCFLFLLPLYIGMAVSGVLYLSRNIESIISKNKAVLYSVLTIALSFWLMVSKIDSEPYLNSAQVRNFDRSGRYIEFEYINACIKYYLQFDYEGDRRVLISFPSEVTTEYWTSRLDDYCGTYFCKKYFIYDVDSYVQGDAQRCHRLYVVSSESEGGLESMFEEQGITISHYSAPRLMHRFNYAGMYKMDRIKDCGGEGR